MAIKERAKYALVETTNVSAVRTGNMAAQYEMEMEALENGMGVMVDDVAKLVKFATAGLDNLYLHASEEQIYEEHLGRNSFRVEGKMLPRVLKLEVGDKFETNAIVPADAVKGAKLYPNGQGLWATTAGTTGMYAVVVELVALPNGEEGARLAIARA